MPRAKHQRFSAFFGLALPLVLAACDADPTSDGTGGSGGDTTSSATMGTGATASGGSGGGEEEIPAVEDPFEVSPEAKPLSDASIASLKSQIDAALNGVSGASHSALIMGLDTKQIVYARTPDTPRVPASNTKLFTTATALARFGEAHAPTVRVFASGLSGGVIAGDVVLIGEHDPANSSWFGDDAREALDATAAYMKKSGIVSVGGGVVAKGEYVYEGNSVGYIDYAGERGEVATAFRNALLAAGITVGGGASGAAGFEPPSGADEIVTLPSASLDVIAHAINVPSHNEFADMLMHHIGFVTSGESTYAAGLVATRAYLDELGIDRTGFTLDDGSGLSHGNEVTPRQIVGLFEAMLARPEGPAYLHSLTISGVRGTLGGRMTQADVAGRFWGKTGTLTGVVALSGVLFHRYDGQRYVASFLSNNVGDATAGRAGLDTAIRALAKNWKDGVALPVAPNLRWLGDDANGKTANAAWDDVPGATGYLVWRSKDGRSWDRADARYVKKLTHRMVGFEGTGRIFVRVTAWNDVGESVPSSVFGCSLSDDGADTLLVDANDRYTDAPVPENPLSFGHDALVLHVEALDDTCRFDSGSNEEALDGDLSLAKYGNLIVALGRESTTDETFSTLEQEALRDFVTDGGGLFVSGAEIGYDLAGEGTPEDAAFANDVLHIDYVADDAETSIVVPTEKVKIDTSFARFSKLGRHEVTFPDVLAPTGSAEVCLAYGAGVAGAACVISPSAAGGKIVVLGVPLEAFDDPVLRRALVALLAP